MKTPLIKFIVPIFFLALGAMAIKAPGPFQAEVDSTTISPGQRIQLSLEYDGLTTQTPDTSGLVGEFEIQSQSMSQSRVNIMGDEQNKTTWVLTIRPLKNSSPLIIRPIRLGAHSTLPIILTVDSQKRATPGFEFTLTADKTSAYVKEQILLTVKIKTTTNFRRMQLTEPHVQGAIMEALGKATSQETVENGQRTFLIEQKFVAFADEAGQLEVAPAQFEGLVQRHDLDFWGGAANPEFFSNDLKVTIKPMPASWPAGEPFLPVENLALVETFNERGPFEVDKALTRRFEIKATSALATFLPTINSPSVPGVKIYSEPGKKIQKSTPDGITASVDFSQVYLPMQGGGFQIPEQTIYWWNTKTNQLATTVIRPLDFEVRGNPNSAPVSPPPAVGETDEIPAPAPPSAADANRETAAEEPFNYWIVATGLFLLLWLATLGLWWWKARKPLSTEKPAEDPNKATLVTNLTKALGRDDAREVYRQLMELKAWATRQNQQTLLASFKDPASPLYMAEQSIAANLFCSTGQGHASLPNKNEILSEIAKATAVRAEGGLKPLYPN
jgi:hypothetical protein